MNRSHWEWCRQQIPVMHPSVIRALELGELDIPPCECNIVTDDMPFIRLSWLLDESCDLRNLPRMQALPKEAFIYPTEMKRAYFISHRWLSLDHPDISGQQLALALSCIWSDYANKTGLWYDHLCLPQSPRTEYEQGQFNKLLLQIPALTITTVPILVVDSGKEYASRAWCVLETIGGYRSGLDMKSVSLAMQVKRYEEVLCGGISSWDQSVKVEDGYREGLDKLQSWTKKSGVSLGIDYMKMEKDMRRHFECMNVLSEIFLFLGSIVKQSHEINDDILLKVASKYNLHCTYDSDVLLCMRLMCNVIKL